MMAIAAVNYHASKTCSLFHKNNDSSVKALMGPIGSGKSVACCWEIMKLCQAQKKSPDGKRKSRWVVVRNTYRELLDTTLKTFHDWFPKDLGVWQAGNLTQTWTFGDVEAEILFRALDRPDDVKKLLSLELTGAFINEAREIPWAVIKMVRGRVGRYPSTREGGASWYGLIMDTNPCDDDHWWYRVFEETKPDGWKLYKQPGGLTPEAENIPNLPDGYYTTMMQGAEEEWVKVYVHGQYGFVREGKPVYPAYSDSTHCLTEIYEPDPNIPLMIGFDFGRTPAAAILQYLEGIGRYIGVDEFLAEDMGADRFAPELQLYLKKVYPGFQFNLGWGDPSGGAGNQSTDQTPFKILRKHGIIARPTKTNDPLIRRSSITGPMGRLCMDGKPAFQISPRCRTWRKGLAGGFYYKRVQVSGDERYQDQPEKNHYSHICEAGEYALYGAGEGAEAIRSSIDPSRFKARRTMRQRKHA